MNGRRNGKGLSKMVNMEFVGSFSATFQTSSGRFLNEKRKSIVDIA
jgi:hypothetical protein